LHRHRQLAGPGAHELAGHSHEVAHVEVAEKREALAEGIAPRVELNGPGAVTEVRETRLTVVTERDDAPGQAYRPRALELVLARAAEARGEVPRPVRHGEPGTERIDPPRAQGRQLLVAPAAPPVGVVRGSERVWLGAQWSV